MGLERCEDSAIIHSYNNECSPAVVLKYRTGRKVRGEDEEIMSFATLGFVTPAVYWNKAEYRNAVNDFYNKSYDHSKYTRHLKLIRHTRNVICLKLIIDSLGRYLFDSLMLNMKTSTYGFCSEAWLVLRGCSSAMRNRRMNITTSESK